MADDKVAAALITGMKGAQMGPPIFNVMPRWLLESLTNMMMKSEDKKAQGDDVTFRMLAPTLHYDFQLVVELSDTLDSFKAIRAEVLLLGGSKSPACLKGTLDPLPTALPPPNLIHFHCL